MIRIFLLAAVAIATLLAIRWLRPGDDWLPPDDGPAVLFVDDATPWLPAGTYAVIGTGRWAR